MELSERIARTFHRIKTLLPQAMLRDQEYLNQSLNSLQKKFSPSFRTTSFSNSRMWTKVLEELLVMEKRLAESLKERRARLHQRPPLNFMPQLPIAEKRQEIVEAIRANRVLIVAGETGCGKSTQLPKMCLGAGRGISGKIACTEPRRIAAISIASRIAEELGEPLGRSVGYKIRFQDRTSPKIYIKVMTDGMLLAETQTDPNLYEYDTIILDEAHERSLNIDFLLGLIKTLLKKRKDLKLIIASATLDTEKFSDAFEKAPVIHIQGRTYPVEVEYVLPDFFGKDGEEGDYIELAVLSVDWLRAKKPRGDILIFMPTERDILDTCEKLKGKKYPHTTILPLFARLPANQQGRIYSVKGNKIVVATNVAETSLTIPGIKYVIDTGLARISQYLPGSGINSLPITPISQASAEQRKGRCGRIQEGLCLRLYDKEDYEKREPFTPPEILRSNLAEVILRMMALKIGNPSTFPFIDKPHPRNIRDGYETLLELGAIMRKGKEYVLTSLGKQMAKMPLDPKISRILLEGVKEDCLKEVSIIASALSIRDPRERPLAQETLADRRHDNFAHPDSDFMTLLSIWERYHSFTSSGVRKKFCHQNFLSYSRMREWEMVQEQITSILREQKFSLKKQDKVEISEPLYARIHRCLLSGFLSHIAVHREKNLYQAAKNREAMIFPGSVLFKKNPPWIVAAEMVKTSRLFARMAARIEPHWIEKVAKDKCSYTYYAPYWDREKGEVRAKERVTIYGLEIVSGRDVSYGAKNPDEAHRVFVREALVNGKVKKLPDFLQHNLRLQKKIREIEDKLRRREIMVDEDAIAEFYSQRLEGIYDLPGLEKMIMKRGGEDFLRMRDEDLLLFHPEPLLLRLYPEEIKFGEIKLKVTYKFKPGEEDDGATLHLPLSLVSKIPPEFLEWGIPGYLKEKILALIRGLPKAWRKKFIPISECAEIIFKEMERKEDSLFKNLSLFVQKRFGIQIPDTLWSQIEIPPHLKMRVSIIDERGREVASGRSLEALKKSLPSRGDDSGEWQRIKQKWERENIASFEFEFLPESIGLGEYLNAFPAFEPAEKGINLRLYKTEEEALASHLKGVERLLSLKFKKDLDFLKKYLIVPEEYLRASLYFGGKETVENGMIEKIKKISFQKNIRSKEEFDSYVEKLIGSHFLFEKSHLLKKATLDILKAHDELQSLLHKIEEKNRERGSVIEICTKIKKELEMLVPMNFLEIYSLERLLHLPRYLNALRMRAERGKNYPEKDRNKEAQVAPFVEAFKKLRDKLGKDGAQEKREALEELRWLIEEFKVSLFAPELKAAQPVSAKKLAIRIKDIKKLFT